VDVDDDEDGFAAARGVGGVISEARGADGGVVDVEGAREVKGVVEKRAVASAREVEGVFNLVSCRPFYSFSANIAS
jgi:hypothetical protein